MSSTPVDTDGNNTNTNTQSSSKPSNESHSQDSLKHKSDPGVYTSHYTGTGTGTGTESKGLGSHKEKISAAERSGSSGMNKSNDELLKESSRSNPSSHENEQINM